MAAKASDDVVAPEIVLPSLFHWYVKGAVPLTDTLNVTALPSVRVELLDKLATVGAVAAWPNMLAASMQQTAVIRPEKRRRFIPYWTIGKLPQVSNLY